VVFLLSKAYAIEENHAIRGWFSLKIALSYYINKLDIDVFPRFLELTHLGEEQGHNRQSIATSVGKPLPIGRKRLHIERKRSKTEGGKEEHR
jgi:hypothetical protein